MMLPIRVGDTLYLNEPDYQYGQGELELVVTAVPRRLDGEWVELKGRQVYWNGQHGEERYVSVRRSALSDPRRRKAR